MADAHQKRDRVFPDKGVFPLLGGKIRIEVQQLLGGEEGHLVGELGAQARVAAVDQQRRIADAAHDVAHRILQEAQGAHLPGDDAFPVPLVHVDGVQVIQLLVAPDGVHVGVDPLAGMKIVAIEGHALPFGQRMHHLRLHARCRDIEGDRTFHAVEVVIEAGGRVYKQRCGHALEVQGLGQMVLKGALDQADGRLRFIQGQGRFITGGDDGMVHGNRPPLSKMERLICGTCRLPAP